MTLSNVNLIKLDDTEQIAIDQYVHTPHESGIALTKLSELIYGTGGISSGSPMMDLFIPPNRPGWTRVWIARPGELKSTMLRIIAKREAERIKREGLKDKCVVIVSYEEAIDTQELALTPGIDKDKFWEGLVEPATVRAATLQRDMLDIYWIGESMLKSSPDQAPMSVNMVMAGINAIKKAYGKTPTLVLWDYIQETYVDREVSDRRQKIIDAMSDVIRMCILLGIPIDIGSQAKQTSRDNQPWPIPKKGDSEYSFYPEQKATNVVGIWRVWETHRDDMLMQNNGLKLQGWRTTFELSPNLTVFRTSKGRYRQQKMSLPVDVDPGRMTVSDLPNARMELAI